MAIATGTAAVIAAGIGAAGGVAGAKIAAGGNRAAGESAERSNVAATEAQLTGSREAIAFAREQEAARKAEHERAAAAYAAQWDARENARLALLQRYGISGQAVPSGITPGAPGAWSAPGAGLTLGKLAGKDRPYTAPTPIGGVPAASEVVPPSRLTLRDLWEWNRPGRRA
jgi:hypothetical protein